jgi:hypothetical protein
MQHYLLATSWLSCNQFHALLLMVADRVRRQRMRERIDQLLQTAPVEGTAWTNQHPIAGGVPVARVWADPATVLASNFWSEPVE